jgi:hypothetical protein
MDNYSARDHANHLVKNKGVCYPSPFYCGPNCFLYNSNSCCTQAHAYNKAVQWLKDNPEPEQTSNPEQEHTSDAHKLALDHWAFINELLESHGIPAESRAIAQFHYVSAFIHGFKHAEEEN